MKAKGAILLHIGLTSICAEYPQAQVDFALFSQISTQFAQDFVGLSASSAREGLKCVKPFWTYCRIQDTE